MQVKEDDIQLEKFILGVELTCKGKPIKILAVTAFYVDPDRRLEGIKKELIANCRKELREIASDSEGRIVQSISADLSKYSSRRGSVSPNYSMLVFIDPSSSDPTGNNTVVYINKKGPTRRTKVSGEAITVEVDAFQIKVKATPVR